MKRKNILIVLLVVLAAVFMPKKVFAANCDLTQAHVFTGDGESTCTLQADLELDSSISISSGTVNIDLNGHNFTMTGSGEAIRVTGTGSLNISGEGTISTGPGTANSPAYSALIFDSTGNLTISGGTFENGIHAQNASSVTIENGTFNGNYAAGFSSIGNLVINNGTFNGTHCGATFSNNASQRINGGTFQGGTFGILINDDNVKPLLYGGNEKYIVKVEIEKLSGYLREDAYLTGVWQILTPGGKVIKTSDFKLKTPAGKTYASYAKAQSKLISELCQDIASNLKK